MTDYSSAYHGLRTRVLELVRSRDAAELGPIVEEMMNDFPPIAVGQMVFDATTHEQDIRGALVAPGGRESDSLAIA